MRLGSRGSALALWQTHYVRDLLQAAWPDLTLTVEIIKTQGDKILDTPLPLIGGKGLFTAELEAALHHRQIDLAVHSLKDLPVTAPPGLIIGATPPRANPADALVSRGGHTLANLPPGAAVGTSSLRRAAQLLHQRPDLRILDIRGNVDSRIGKVLDNGGPYDAIVLAYAGLERLARLDVVSQILSSAEMTPAPGQGSLAIQCRDETASVALLRPLHDPTTEAAVTAERAFLAALGGGCALPIAAHATLSGDQLHVHGRVTAVDGSKQIDVTLIGERTAAQQAGFDLAQVALNEGAADLLN